MHLQHADRADQARLPRRLVKDHQNPFAAYSEEEFVQRYLLSKECIHTLLGQVEPDLPRAKDGRGKVNCILFLASVPHFSRDFNIFL